MCFIRDKWTKFEPTKKYLETVKPLTSVTKLHNFIKIYSYIPEKGDHWKTPIEFLNDGGGDCDDFARFTVDVLVRITGIKDARFIAYYGGLKGHAICAFPYYGKYSVFSNKQLIHGFANYIEIGHRFFPKGFKRMVVRDWQGNIIKKTRKWIGKF
ncbi:hypothetical protein KAS33_02495 [bacterium]|nr:hypothetical protein [bacterium]